MRPTVVVPALTVTVLVTAEPPDGPGDEMIFTLAALSTAVSARVEDCEVTLTAAPIPQRMWTAMTRYAQGMGQLEDAVEGKFQSVHLEHLLEGDWGE